MRQLQIQDFSNCLKPTRIRINRIVKKVKLFQSVDLDAVKRSQNRNSPSPKQIGSLFPHLSKLISKTPDPKSPTYGFQSKINGILKSSMANYKMPLK